VPQAKELARHSDVRTTMRCTHIGIEDQAKALSSLPVPTRQAPKQMSESTQPQPEGALHFSRLSEAMPVAD
jgi:hypothetical protein